MRCGNACNSSGSARSQLLDLAGPLEDIRERLEEILERERAELSFRDDDDARTREAFLDALPPDAPGQIGRARGSTGSSTRPRSACSTSCRSTSASR